MIQTVCPSVVSPMSTHDPNRLGTAGSADGFRRFSKLLSSAAKLSRRRKASSPKRFSHSNSCQVGLHFWLWLLTAADRACDSVPSFVSCHFVELYIGLKAGVSLMMPVTRRTTQEKPPGTYQIIDSML
ncbi:unnamed protein product [Protopolystoma xenopodis]|uniref:Uncharacterized protein n=1 Tax=Protopolystoma xenopodis TaxID=117903 RepID=A0A3S5C8B9_9PLAT|nr:unnamed protein product [Protopolystoma xenopodis]